MASLAWIHERLDEMCARVSAEAAGKADRILLAMEPAEMPWSVQRDHFRRTGRWLNEGMDPMAPVYWHYTPWELSRIVLPRILADLDALDSPQGSDAGHAGFADLLTHSNS